MGVGDAEDIGVEEIGACGGRLQVEGGERRWDDGGGKGMKENKDGEYEGGKGKAEIKEEFFIEGDFDLIFLRK